jgi:hypothetical protein
MAVKDMKRIKHLFVLILLFCMVQATFSQGIGSDINRSFRTGDADLLSEYFNSRLKLSILNHEYDPSQQQAKEIMREFFRDHNPSSFEQKFESEKKGSRFIIGVPKTSTGDYRVNVFFKKFDDKDLIHLLRIEKENESTF